VRTSWLILFSLLCGGSQLSGAETLVERGADGWRYCESPTIECEAWSSDGWTAAEFDDSTWPQGRAMLGYGDPDVATELSFGVDPQRKETSALFRRRFQTARNPGFRLLRGRICADDGAIVFLNGREVFRHNLPSGTINYSTRAVRAIGPAAEDERRYHQFAVPPEMLVDGDNVVAVSVHQANATSSDMALDLELMALTSEQEVSGVQEELKRQSKAYQEVEATSGQIGPVIRFELSGD
jgi:hypothetical protein